MIRVHRAYQDVNGVRILPRDYQENDLRLSGLTNWLIQEGYAVRIADPELPDSDDDLANGEVDSDSESLSDLRNRYKELAGKGASPKWDAETLREKIKALEDAESDNQGL